MNNNKKNILIVLGLSFFMLTPFACTDLEENIHDTLTPDILFENPDNLIYAFGTAYTNLYNLYGHKYSVGRDCGTDILVVPQRGGDWFDGGEWHRYHRHEWTPKESYVDFSWNLLFKGVSTCNQLIEQFEGLKIDEDKKQIAIDELRAFRALYYLWLIDVYGNIPIVTQFDVPVDFAPPTNSRAEVFSFIETELTDVKDNLNKEVGALTYGRVTHYVAQMALAKLYLNAEVYTGTAQWDKANATLDVIIDANKFSLSGSFLDNFVEATYYSPEIIMGVPFDEVNAAYFEVHLFSLHYNLKDKFGMKSLPWNGLCVQESFFNSFEENDIRRNGLLFGPQEDADGNIINDPGYEKFDPSDPGGVRDPDGKGLNLTPEINMLEPACLRQAGARILKWPIAPGSIRYLSNDFAIYRYADVLLMKAEVLLRNGDEGAALDFVNQVRARSNASSLTSLTMEDLLAERGREFFVEGHRRSDMIRFGKYLDTRWEKDQVSPEHVTLWPIPEKQINGNGNLIQNPGY